MRLTWGAIARVHQTIGTFLLWLARHHVWAEGFYRQRQAGLTARWSWREVAVSGWPVGVGALVLLQAWFRK